MCECVRECGIVYLDEDETNPHTYIIRFRPNQKEAAINAIMAWVVDDRLNFDLVAAAEMGVMILTDEEKYIG